MMKPLVVVVIGCLFFFSCKEEKPPIPQDTMVNMLIDLHMAEAMASLLAVESNGMQSKNYDTLFVLYRNIYAANNMDTAQFNNALYWYEQHPKIFNTVYEQVLEKLSLTKEDYLDTVKVENDTAKVPTIDTL